MSGPAVTAKRRGRKSMAPGRGVARAEELPGGRACWEGSMAHLTPACPLPNQARPLTPSTHSPPGDEVVQLLGDEHEQPDATACGDLLMYYRERCWQNVERGLHRSPTLTCNQIKMSFRFLLCISPYNARLFTIIMFIVGIWFKRLSNTSGLHTESLACNLDNLRAEEISRKHFRQSDIYNFSATKMQVCRTCCRHVSRYQLIPHFIEMNPAH